MIKLWWKKTLQEKIHPVQDRYPAIRGTRHREILYGKGDRLIS